MSVKIRPYRGKEGVWEVDIVVRMADGKILRERRRAPVTGKSAVHRWAQERERYLIQYGTSAASTPALSVVPVPMATPATPRDAGKEYLTLAEFAPTFLEGYYKAERKKPATCKKAESNLRLYLVPILGKARLDQLGPTDVKRLKAKMADFSPKTVNGVLMNLIMLMRCAMAWGEIPKREVEITLLREPPQKIKFYEAEELQRLLDVAKARDPFAYAAILLGVDAGLRNGEIRALHWSSVDFRRGNIRVEWTDFEGTLTEPKSNRLRDETMTKRLAAALLAIKDGASPYVLYREDGSRFTASALEYKIRKIQWDAGIRTSDKLHTNRGQLHKLRHTCGSRLASKGVPAVAIKEILGHRSLTTTELYMHLAPKTLASAIDLLEE